jgi:hypothetical protein
MGTFKEKGFADRQSAAATAKKAELEKFRARSAALEPASAKEQSADWLLRRLAMFALPN